MEEKIYVGSGKSKFDGNLVSCSLCLTDLPAEHIYEYNNKKYIKLNVQKKKEEDQYGKTHSVSIDTWKPDAKKETAPPVKEKDDLPF
jgi:hypothetical protein|tara:strand:+ start:25 stop:285 length:261 start_codon:yes stop_codon:yes gene_type:complete